MADNESNLDFGSAVGGTTYEIITAAIRLMQSTAQCPTPLYLFIITRRVRVRIIMHAFATDSHAGFTR